MINLSNLLKDNKLLMKEYDFEQNSNIDINKINIGSNKKAWWKCEKGHEWQATIDSRKKNSCPICSNKITLVGYNDLATTNPELTKEWNYSRNKDFEPTMVTYGSHKKVWWVCSKGHEWQASIHHRNNGSGCPICSNRLALKGYNDLVTINPKLAKEWNYEKNGNLKPDMVTSNSNKKVWWKCEKGHEWQVNIVGRNASGSKCPICTKELQTSFPEQAIYYYIKKLFPDAINGDRHLGIELDIYIPSKDFAIEYDGIFWHKDKKRDEKKNNICKDNKIVLFRVREEKYCPWTEDNYLKVIYCNGTDSSLEKSIKMIISYLGKNLSIDLNEDRTDIYSSFIISQKEQSLLSINSEVAKEWNYEKNGILKPDMVPANSNKKVWWKCSKGHEYQAKIVSRNNGSGCPFCSGQQVLTGYNDLATKNPTLAKEWDYEKNENLKPDMVTSNSNQKVWWKCSKGHEWNAVICNRNKGTGCPVCTNVQTLTGYNDLVTTNPELAKEWNYEKNGNLDPSTLKATSEKKVWWKCSKGHEWKAKVDSRKQGTGCPFCSGQQVLKGYNDLATTNPSLVTEWNYGKNGDLKPDMVTSGSNQKIWWKCSKGHEWCARVISRSKGVGCPICSNKQVLKGYNDLATTNPSLVTEWNYGKNGDLKPDMVTSGSGKKVWWKCSKGHEWLTSIHNRTIGTKCPICSNAKVLEGYNDLATLNPILAAEWNYEKNNDLSPIMFTANSGKQVWWKCSKGHEWIAEIRARNRGAKCPYCHK